MKRFFQIIDTTGELEPIYYDNKMKAKSDRNELNSSEGSERFVLNYGPDHKKFSATERAA